MTKRVEDCVPLSNNNDNNNNNVHERFVEVICIVEHLYCSVYYVNPIVCIRKSDAADNIDADAVWQYFWFATKDAGKMYNSWKRNMLYCGT